MNPAIAIVLILLAAIAAFAAGFTRGRRHKLDCPRCRALKWYSTNPEHGEDE